MNGQQIAEIRERQICNFLDRFGYASAKSIAQFVYADCEKKAAGVSANRTLKRLAEKKLILKRSAWNGTTTYVNTIAGGRLGKNPKIAEASSGIELSTVQNVRQERIIEKMVAFKKLGFACFGQIGINRNLKEYAGCHAIAIKGSKKIAIFFVANSSEGKIDFISKWYRTHKIDEVVIISNENSEAVTNTVRKLTERHNAELKKISDKQLFDKILRIDENKRLLNR